MQLQKTISQKTSIVLLATVQKYGMSQRRILSRLRFLRKVNNILVNLAFWSFKQTDKFEFLSRTGQCRGAGNQLEERRLWRRSDTRRYEPVRQKHSDYEFQKETG